MTGTETGGNPYDGVVIPVSHFPCSAHGHVRASVLSGQFNGLFHGYSKSYPPIVRSDLQPRLGITAQVLRRRWSDWAVAASCSASVSTMMYSLAGTRPFSLPSQ